MSMLNRSGDRRLSLRLRRADVARLRFAAAGCSLAVVVAAGCLPARAANIVSDVPPTIAAVRYTVGPLLERAERIVIVLGDDEELATAVADGLGAEVGRAEQFLSTRSRPHGLSDVEVLPEGVTLVEFTKPSFDADRSAIIRVTVTRMAFGRAQWGGKVLRMVEGPDGWRVKEILERFAT